MKTSQQDEGPKDCEPQPVLRGGLLRAILRKTERDMYEPHKFICSICNRLVDGFSANAQPINEGRCCHECDWGVVIPARMRRLKIGLPMRDCRYNWTPDDLMSQEARREMMEI